MEGLQAAVDRACACVEAGADMIFPEGLQTEREFADFATEATTQITLNAATMHFRSGAACHHADDR
ncbi:MAG: hypothetical protein EBW98_00140 [Actinobacteria bacterium]|nr:hypothetical protein [Actinomycetota bacterium]